MGNFEITDPLFRKAVEAIDSGSTGVLKRLLQDHPKLASKRLDKPSEGYFQYPYLLWFVADNPIRNERLPANITEVTRILIDAAVSYTHPDAADERSSVDLGGRRIIKK